MHLNRTPLADGIDAFMRLALHVHLLTPAAEQPSDVRRDRILVRADLGRSQMTVQSILPTSKPAACIR